MDSIEAEDPPSFAWRTAPADLERGLRASENYLDSHGGSKRLQDPVSSLWTRAPGPGIVGLTFFSLFNLLAVFLAIALVFLGGWPAVQNYREAIEQESPDSFSHSLGLNDPTILMSYALVLLGILILGTQNSLQIWVLRILFFWRPGSLFRLSFFDNVINFYLDDLRSYQSTMHVVPGDACLCFLDKRNKRLLLDGFCYRIVIRSDDFRAIDALTEIRMDGGLKPSDTPAVKIYFRIQGTDVGLVLSRSTTFASVIRLKLHVFFSFLRGRYVEHGSEKLARQLLDALGYEQHIIDNVAEFRLK